MCGIAGQLSQPYKSGEELAALAREMADAMVHRGPDSAGVWVDANAGVALGHRRLAVVDLSEAGSQPMVSACGRFVLVLNGEIYNHPELRRRLALEGVAPPWRGHSDTETLLAGIAAWGVRATLERAIGMFALALWDRKSNVISLARDRFGEKPLYYGWVRNGMGRGLVFASELKALRQSTGLSPEISRIALQQYFKFLYIPAPLTIYKDARKLEAGHLLEMTLPEIQAGRVCRSRPFWDLKSTVSASYANQFTDEAGAIDAVESALRSAIRGQMLSDVPIGAFLSGGIDSSLIAALMQQEASRPISTFTVGFEEAAFDESQHARAVAKHLGTDHTELFVTAKEARDVIPLLPQIYDEPFADSSQIPTHLVCRAARHHVTVALSGDGGDELFGGYNRYLWAPGLWERLSLLPFPIRRGLGVAMQRITTARWDLVGSLVNRFRHGASGVGRLGSKVHKLAAVMQSARDPADMYSVLTSTWLNPELLVATTADDSYEVDSPQWPIGLTEVSERMMYQDVGSYLSDDILCKVDRAAMACSLETRAPFLDSRVAEVAWRLPLSMKIRGTTGKWALRKVLYKYVPSELIERPKSGFSIPLGLWLRGPLRPWVESLIGEDRLNREGYIQARPVHEFWNEHLQGRADRSAELWSVLMFQSWLERSR